MNKNIDINNYNRTISSQRVVGFLYSNVELGRSGVFTRGDIDDISPPQSLFFWQYFEEVEFSSIV